MRDNPRLNLVLIQRAVLSALFCFATRLAQPLHPFVTLFFCTYIKVGQVRSIFCEHRGYEGYEQGIYSGR